MSERTYAKRLAESRKNMSPDAISRAKNERCKLRNAKLKAERQAVIAERQAKWDILTPAQKLVELDRRLGKDKGAKRQRERLTIELGKWTEALNKSPKNKATFPIMSLATRKKEK